MARFDQLAWPAPRAFLKDGESHAQHDARGHLDQGYPNRRLYDRQARRYITLQDLEALVMEGKKIEVRDSKTGEDLTRAILTQILLERHPERMEMFPVAMLHGILQANDMVLDFFRAYLRQSVAVLEQLQQPTPQATFLAPVDWMRAVMPSAIPFTAALPSTVGPAEPRRLELEDLRDGRKNQATGAAGSPCSQGRLGPKGIRWPHRS